MKYQLFTTLSLPDLKEIIKESVQEAIHENTSVLSKNSNTTPRKVKIDELCDIYGFYKPSVYRWANQRKIPHSKPGKELLFDLDEVEEWINTEYRRKTRKEILKEYKKSS